MRHETLFLFINNVGLVAIFKKTSTSSSTPDLAQMSPKLRWDGSELNVDQISAVI